MPELFDTCELTFAGNKSPGWKDDVTFRASPAAPEPAGRAVDRLARATSDADAADEESAEGVVSGNDGCAGEFWRNLNRDRGRYTLSRCEVGDIGEDGEDGTVREDDGDAGGGGAGTAGGGWILTLDWDRWDPEILRLTGRFYETWTASTGRSGLFFEGVHCAVVVLPRLSH